MPTYEIVRRGDSQHRAGHFEILIDGWPAEYTNDPAQHVKRMLSACLAEGMAPEQAAIHAQERADVRSQLVLQRVVNSIKAGKLFPGGAPLGPMGIDADALPRTKKVRASEAIAARAFMSRGRFTVPVFDTNGIIAGSRPITEDERRAMVKARDTRTDHTEIWKAGRRKLIADVEAEVSQVRTRLADATPQQVAAIQKKLKRLEDRHRALIGSGIYNATHGFQYAHGQTMTGNVDLVTDDMRIVPLMTNTTVDTERDAKDAVSDFTTLDEFDGSGYSTGGLALDNQAVNIDDANDRAEFDADDEVVATLAAGTRAIDGLLLIKWITNLNSSLPYFWLEFASDFTPSGGEVTFAFNAEGIVQASG